MELVKTILNLQFATAFNPWLELRGLLRLLGDNPSAEIQGPPVVIDLRSKGRRVALMFRALRLEQEGAVSIDESVAPAVELVSNVNGVSRLPSILGIRFDSMFIEPYSLPFHELVGLIKGRYLRSNPIVDSATDIGLIFDQHEGDVVKHIQIGPMEIEQLNSMFLIWPREGLPKQFTFISVSYEQQKETPFDTNRLREFLETAARWQTSQAEMVLSLLQEEGG